jgi:hypothetical protein
MFAHRAGIKMILRFPGDGPPHPPTGGWETKVLRPSNSRVAVVLPDDGDKGMAHICTGPAGRVIPATVDPRGRRSTYPYINGTHTFFRLTLAAGPKEVVMEAEKAAEEDIATAYAEIMSMNYTDTGYQPLNDLYALANKEYYQGNNFYSKALLSSGHEANFYFSKSVTAFTRSQVHAMQLYEALVPAPTSPSDLGLKPFGGDWATASGFFPIHLDFVQGAGLLVALTEALAAGSGLLKANLASLRLAIPIALIASASAVVGAKLGLWLDPDKVQTCFGRPFWESAP